MEENRVVWPGWETVRLIGGGSFGTVYEIQRDVFGDVEKAALKMISIPQNAGDIDEMYSDGYDAESITNTFRSHLKSIVAEYSLMRKMNGSANIVSCDDVRYIQHTDGIGWDIFIKMELLTPLTKAVSPEMPEATVIKIAKDLCAALALCQKYGILHRDIKPSNIFVSDHGDYKLGDFGIAKTVEKTMGGTVIGTYKYMAPEVYHNQPYGIGVDIYSLGLVLYWLLNERRLPFLPLPPAIISAGMESTAHQRRFSGEAIPAPKNGSEKLKAIVLKACAYDPKDRYASATQMLAELNALPVESQPAPVPVPELIPDPVDAFDEWERTRRLDFVVPGPEPVPQPEDDLTEKLVPEHEPEPQPDPEPEPERIDWVRWDDTSELDFGEPEPEAYPEMKRVQVPSKKYVGIIAAIAVVVVSIVLALLLPQMIRTKTLESIEINTRPDYLSYRVGDRLDTTGLTLLARYSDGSTEIIRKGFACSPEKFTKAGTIPITVVYKNREATFWVFVVESSLESTQTHTVQVLDFGFRKNTSNCNAAVGNHPFVAWHCDYCGKKQRLASF